MPPSAMTTSAGSVALAAFTAPSVAEPANSPLTVSVPVEVTSTWPVDHSSVVTKSPGMPIARGALLTKRTEAGISSSAKLEPIDVRRLLQVVLSGDAAAALAELDEAHDLGIDPTQLLRGLLESLHSATRAKASASADPLLSAEEWESAAESYFAPRGPIACEAGNFPAATS